MDDQFLDDLDDLTVDLSEQLRRQPNTFTFPTRNHQQLPSHPPNVNPVDTLDNNPANHFSGYGTTAAPATLGAIEGRAVFDTETRPGKASASAGVYQRPPGAVRPQPRRQASAAARPSHDRDLMKGDPKFEFDDSALQSALSDSEDLAGDHPSANLVDQLSSIDVDAPTDIPPREGLYSTPLSWERPRVGLPDLPALGRSEYQLSPAEQAHLLSVALGSRAPPDGYSNQSLENLFPGRNRYPIPQGQSGLGEQVGASPSSIFTSGGQAEATVSQPSSRPTTGVQAGRIGRQRSRVASSSATDLRTTLEGSDPQRRLSIGLPVFTSNPAAPPNALWETATPSTDFGLPTDSSTGRHQHDYFDAEQDEDEENDEGSIKDEMTLSQKPGEVAKKGGARSTRPPPKPGRSAHNDIERKYRTNLKDKIAALRDAVPSLRGSASEEGEDGDEGEGAGNSEQGKNPKVSKGTVLTKATQYIHYLERRNKAIVKEHQELSRRIEAFEQLLSAAAATRPPAAYQAPPGYPRNPYDPRGFC